MKHKYLAHYDQNGRALGRFLGEPLDPSIFVVLKISDLDPEEIEKLPDFSRWVPSK